MKAARFIMKVIATLLAVAAAVCCIVAYWDKIVDVAEYAREKFTRKVCPECDDYADWDD